MATVMSLAIRKTGARDMRFPEQREISVTSTAREPKGPATAASTAIRRPEIAVGPTKIAFGNQIARSLTMVIGARNRDGSREDIRHRTSSMRPMP